MLALIPPSRFPLLAPRAVPLTAFQLSPALFSCTIGEGEQSNEELIYYNSW